MLYEEEQCFNDISYLIARLCLHQNEVLVNFYTQSTTKHPREFQVPTKYFVADKIPLINHSPNVLLRKRNIIADQLVICNSLEEKISTTPPSIHVNDSQMPSCTTQKSNNLSYEDIFLNKQILFKLAFSISDLAETEYDSYHIKYKVIGRLVRVCTKLIDTDFDSLLHPIIKCLDSNMYLTVFDTVNLQQPIFDPKQAFFIRECFNFIDQHGYKQQIKIAKDLFQSMLKNTTEIFAKYLPVTLAPNDSRKSSTISDQEKIEEAGIRMQALSHHIKILNYFASTPSIRKEFISLTIIDDILSIVRKGPFSLIHSQLYHANVGTIAWSLTLLYNLMFDKNLFKMLKEKDTLHICEKFHAAKNDTIHFTSKNITALLKQKDIDEIQDPYRLTKSYFYYLKNTLKQPNQKFQGIPLANTLNTLETISQNDDIKEEIAKDNHGFEMLSECACDPKFDEKTVQQPAMRIIFTVSCVGEIATEKIKEDDKLLKTIQKNTASTEISKERVANGIMWNIENERKFMENAIDKQERAKEIRTQLSRPSTPPQLTPAKIMKIGPKTAPIYNYIRGDYQEWEKLCPPSKPEPVPEESKEPEPFDLMISYCHAQRDICHRLYDCLVKDNYSVWIDKENMYGSVLESMAEAIERSNIVLMCISNKYKESNACQLEAKYAWKRKKKTIPVKVEEKYDPMGWLGLLCSDDTYIDFIKLGFDKAYKELLKEIQKIKNSDRK
ncbi:unnamed protein product [Rotaria socialis]|uniref:TIR domain-containing protein n=2 Tax=Rotaria socialis TaxID=392032 RepID=A0A820Y021_9BILA|nr:unnamed protein product [Rotaria socialis]